MSVGYEKLSFNTFSYERGNMFTVRINNYLSCAAGRWGVRWCRDFSACLRYCIKQLDAVLADAEITRKAIDSTLVSERAEYRRLLLIVEQYKSQHYC